MKLTVKESKRDRIIKMHTENIGLSAKGVAFQVGTNLAYTEECIAEYKKSIGSTTYYDMGIAPSMNKGNVFFLFSDNGTEKELHKEGNIVHSEDNITELERFFIRTNLGCDTIFITTEKNSKK